MAWLQLFRIALAPSVIWDGIAGTLIAFALYSSHGGNVEAGIDLGRLCATITAMLCIFHAGMAWNDWRDIAIDRAAGRKRPLVDGRIAPSIGFLAGAILFGAALGITAIWLPEHLSVVTTLCALVAIYDMSGKALRVVAGPILLAVCRMLSLSLGMLVVLTPLDILRTNAHWALLSYGMYLLFLARLASHEEEGLPGHRGVIPVAACTFAPAVMTSAAESWIPFLLGWIIFSAWMLRPALRDRHMEWSPARVQQEVRRCLMGMPMIPALSLLSSPAPTWWAVGGLAATLSVSRMLMSSFPPE
ncbi:MAG: hypothetical protein MK209_02740 [Planctomycetes bacterium]|nr:hypothetical protein [Planctomycetota bacterium]